MSADAKVWTEEDGRWSGIHDGACSDPSRHRAPRSDGYDLAEVLEGIESCLCRCDGHMRWEFRTYPDGKAGLAGFA